MVIALQVFYSPANASTRVLQKSDVALVVETTTSYVLGDNDTRIDARNIALDAAKREASETAGSYVESELIIENDLIKKDQISTFSAAFLRTEIVSEAFVVTKEQRSQLTLVVRATVDKTQLKQKLNLLKSDVARQTQFTALEKENNALRSELDRINREISGAKQPSATEVRQIKIRPELVSRRDTVLAKLDENRSSIQKVFEKGALLQLAQKSGDDFQKARDDIRTNVWEYMKANIQINLGDPEFRDNQDGTYDVIVMVHWSLNPDPIVASLSSFYWDSKKMPIKIDGYENKELELLYWKNANEKQKKPYSEKLLAELTSRRGQIRVTAGKISAQISIAVPCDNSNVIRRCGEGKDFVIQFNNEGDSQDLLMRYADKEQQNPVVLKRVPKSVLANLTSLSAELVLVP